MDQHQPISAMPPSSLVLATARTHRHLPPLTIAPTLPKMLLAAAHRPSHAARNTARHCLSPPCRPPLSATFLRSRPSILHHCMHRLSIKPISSILPVVDMPITTTSSSLFFSITRCHGRCSSFPLPAQDAAMPIGATTQHRLHLHHARGHHCPAPPSSFPLPSTPLNPTNMIRAPLPSPQAHCHCTTTGYHLPHLCLLLIMRHCRPSIFPSNCPLPPAWEASQAPSLTAHRHL